MISSAKKYMAMLLAFVCVCMIFSPLTAYAAEDSSQHETVKVGFFALYFVIKWAVKNGIKEAYSAITGKKTVEDIQNEKELKELGLDSEDQ